MIFQLKSIAAILLSYFAVFIVNGQTPTPTVGLLMNTPEAFNGYTLFMGGQKNTYLVNNCGELINKWESGFSAGSTAYLMPNGNLIRPIRFGNTNFTGGGIGGTIEIVDWYGNLIWNYEYHENNSHHQHHDIEPLPNGNILVLAWGFVDGETAFLNGRSNDGDVWPTQIVEVQPTGDGNGKIVWSWTVWDHIIQDIDSNRLNYGNVFQHPELLNANFGNSGSVGSLRGGDWLHCNSIEYIEDFDLILVSSKYLSEVFIIDHSTTTEEAASHTGGAYRKGGDFLYRWGNPQNYKRGEPADKKLKGQHDAIWISKTDTSPAEIMVVNNGNRGTVDSWIPPINQNGFFISNEFQAFGPVDFNWSHSAAIRSAIGCSARRMANGNTVYCDAQTGLIEEVTQNFEKVWQYQNPVKITGPVEQGTDISAGNFSGFGSFRAEKYPVDYLNENLDLSPKGVIELSPYESTCSLYVAAPLDSMITIIDTMVNNTDSMMTNVDSMLINNINEFYNLEVEIYPSPANTWLNVSSNYNLFNRMVVCNIANQVMIDKNFESKIDVNALKPGLYVLKLIGNQHKVVRKVLVN